MIPADPFLPFLLFHLCAHPLWFAFLLTPSACDSFFFFLEAWAQATGATLPVFMKSPECPDLGSPWPMTVWCRCMEAEHLRSELPCGIRGGHSVWDLAWAHILAWLPLQLPSCFSHSLTGLPGSTFFMHLLLRNPHLRVCFWVPRLKTDRPPFL